MDDDGFPLGVSATIAEDPTVEAPSRCGGGGGTCSSSASVITWESSSPSSEATSPCPSPARAGLPHPTPAPLPSLLMPPASTSICGSVPLPPLSPAGSPLPSSSPPSLCAKSLAALLAATAKERSAAVAPSWRPIEHLGTKSPFDAPVGSRHLVVESPYATDFPSTATCGGSRLLHVSLLIRHGTREPTRGCAARMRRVHSLLSGLVAEVGSPPPAWLVAWERRLSEWERRPGLLAPSGVHEMHAAGGRFAQRYHAALADVYEKGGGKVAGLLVRATYKERAVSSARAFAAGYMAKRATWSTDTGGSTAGASAAPCHRLRPPTERLIHAFCDGRGAPPGVTTLRPLGGSRTTTRRPLLSPGPVVVLSSGRDAALRFYDANTEYLSFVRRHKAVGRAVTAAASPSAPTTVASDEAVPASTLKALGAALSGVAPAALTAAGFGLPELASIADAVAFATDTDGGVLADLLDEPTVAALVAAEERVRHFHRGHDRFAAATGPLCGDLARSLEAAAAVAAAQWGGAAKSKRRKKKRCAGGGDSGGRRPAAVGDLRFAHAETLVPLLLLLGIDGDSTDGDEDEDDVDELVDAGSDDPDGGDVPPPPSRPRPRRRSGMSAMCPFGASLAIELHAPPAGSAGDVPPRVRFRLQERYVRVVRACAPHGADGSVDLPVLLSLLRRVQAEDARVRGGGALGGGGGLHQAGRVAVAVAGACGRRHR